MNMNFKNLLCTQVNVLIRGKNEMKLRRRLVSKVEIVTYCEETDFLVKSIKLGNCANFEKYKIILFES